MTTIGRSMASISINGHNLNYSKDGPITGSDLKELYDLVKGIEAMGREKDDTDQESETEENEANVMDAGINIPRPMFFD